MKVPKYIKQKIRARCEYQEKANGLQNEIEKLCERHSIDIGEYQNTHVCLYTEPRMVMKIHLEFLESEDTE